MSSISETTHFTTVDLNLGEQFEYETEVKRSRFLTVLQRIDDLEQARATIAQRRKDFFDASHHCSAVVVGEAGEITHSSDDGEPPKTAGIPMLGVLTHRGLTQVVAVVTRWFGGTKLGTGGLARAYADAVAQTVTRCGTREVVKLTRVVIDVPVAQAGQIEQTLRHLTLASGRFHVLATRWGQQAQIDAVVSPGALDEFAAELSALSAGGCQARPTGDLWWESRH